MGFFPLHYLRVKKVSTDTNALAIASNVHLFNKTGNSEAKLPASLCTKI